MKPRNLKHRPGAMESNERRSLQPTKSSAKPSRLSRQRSVGYISQMLREGFRLQTWELQPVLAIFNLLLRISHEYRLNYARNWYRQKPHVSVRYYARSKTSRKWSASGKLHQNKSEGAMNQLTTHKKEYTRNQGDLYCAFEIDEGRFGLSEEARAWNCFP